MRQERKAREERKASRVAATRCGPEPRPRDSEPDLIGVGRRELQLGGHSSGGSGRPGAQIRQGREPHSHGGALMAHQALLPGPSSRCSRTRSGLRPTTTSGSPFPPPPSLFSPKYQNFRQGQNRTLSPAVLGLHTPRHTLIWMTSSRQGKDAFGHSQELDSTAEEQYELSITAQNGLSIIPLSVHN